jgi:cell division protein FtsQ
MAKRKRKPSKKAYSDYSPSVRERIKGFHPFKWVSRSLFLHKSLYIIFGVLAVLLIAGVIAYSYVSNTYTVNQFYVSGNIHYTNEEIINMVIKTKMDHNSLFLSLKYRDKSIEDIPFIEKMDVDILSPDTVRINVYEKAVAGYISYLDRYMYFDRDGIVVESSFERSDNVPEVMGLDFDYVIMHEKLPVENEGVFAEILDITQLLYKYKLHADKIFFDSNFNVYLYCGSIEVSLGTEEYIDEKIIQLQYILPELEGKAGLLELKDYDESTRNITFEERKQ